MAAKSPLFQDADIFVLLRYYESLLCSWSAVSCIVYLLWSDFLTQLSSLLSDLDRHSLCIGDFGWRCLNFVNRGLVVRSRLSKLVLLYFRIPWIYHFNEVFRILVNLFRILVNLYFYLWVNSIFIDVCEVPLFWLPTYIYLYVCDGCKLL